MSTRQWIALSCLPFWLVGCAMQMPPSQITASVPAQWQAQLPHQGVLGDLSQWWQQTNDPLLVQLIDAAQAVSPSIASASTRIEQARATRVAAGAALLPTLEASVSASRSNAQLGIPLSTITSGAVQASWEIDLFGANHAARDSAQARFEGAQAGWHDARVSVAAEVANQYYALRACEQLLVVTRSDAVSRAETARLAALSAEAGFQAPATAALARASAAEGRGRATQQRALCDIDIKALVALSAVAEPALRAQLALLPGDLSTVGAVPVASVPAQMLTQRPDVLTAERAVAAASADVGTVQAQRFPRLSLSGSVGAANFRSGAVATNLSTWSIGPLALTLPLFDGGTRAANVDAAQARYAEAVVQYRASVRQAVREVEEALVNLNSIATRGDDVLIAAESYRTAYNGTESRYRSGLASLVELEDVRRTRLAAETTLVLLQRERVAAWIALYRAVGGGWTIDRLAANTPDLRP